MTRQKLALVVVGPPSVSLRRMNGFSPVIIRWLGSADMLGASLAIWLRRYFTACAGGRLWQVGETHGAGSAGAAPLPGASHQFETHLATDHFSGALQGQKGDVAVLGIKQAADLAAACAHPLGKALARQVLRLHRLLDLPGQHLLDGDSLEGFAGSLGVQEIIEGGKPLGAAWCFSRCHGGLL